MHATRVHYQFIHTDLQTPPGHLLALGEFWRNFSKPYILTSVLVMIKHFSNCLQPVATCDSRAAHLPASLTFATPHPSSFFILVTDSRPWKTGEAGHLIQDAHAPGEAALDVQAAHGLHARRAARAAQQLAQALHRVPSRSLRRSRLLPASTRS